MPTSSASGSWSVGATWVGGVIPADNETVTISAGHSILMDYDSSAMTGFQTVTIQGHATTPGMLYFRDGTSGYLKIRTGYNLVGSTGTLKGRLLANSDGVWGNTGSLAFANKAVIDLGATSSIVAQYLNIALYCTQPTTLMVGTYGTKYTVTGSATNDTLTKTTHGWANTTPVMVRVSGGSLPTPLTADTVYYVVNTATDTFKLAYFSGGTSIDLTTDGSGTIEAYSGHTNLATDTMNVLTNVTGDAAWVTTADHNRVCLVDAFAPAAEDQQRLTLVAIAAGTIQLSVNIDSVQYPGARIGLTSRNVSIRSACVTGVNIVDYSLATTSSGIFQCEINATAGTGTTFNGTGIYYGTGHIISGTIQGCSTGINFGTGFTISGTIQGCTYGISSGTGCTISGTIQGCTTGINASSGNTISGTIQGCGQAIFSSIANTISGTIQGCLIGINSGTVHTVSGTIQGCAQGIYYGTGHIISGTIQGCSQGVTTGIGHTVSGTIQGCTYGINLGTGYTISGTIQGCTYGIQFVTGSTVSGTIQGCTNNFLFHTYSSGYGLKIICTPKAVIGTPPTFSNRNAASTGSVGRYGVYCDGYGNSLTASYAFLMSGDVIRNNATLRSGGATSSIECVPLSTCAIDNWMQIFEWTESNVPASGQTRSVYLSQTGFSGMPTAAELYWEAEYISNGTTLATTVIASTTVLTDTNWKEFPLTFTPAAAMTVIYRGYLKKYTAGAKVFWDAALYRGTLIAVEGTWINGESRVSVDYGSPPTRFPASGATTKYSPPANQLPISINLS